MIWPVTSDSILQMMVGMVASAMVGRIGANCHCRDRVSRLESSISWALFFGISTGVTVLVARCYGAREMAEARKIAFHGLLSAVISDQYHDDFEFYLC
jgi:Na+-driven multidrug efflux pump